MNVKSVILATFAAMATVPLCGCEANDGSMATTPVKYEQKDKVAEVSIKADFPAENSVLGNVVAEYFSERLGGTYAGSMADGNAIASFYGKAKYAELSKESREIESHVPLFCVFEMKKAFETASYVTFTTTTENYLGGAHGFGTAEGVTFRKSDGRRFGSEMLVNTDGEAFRKLIKEGLKEYFGDTGMPDADLKKMLLVEDDVNYLPLPKTAPYLSPKGVVFTYQAFEIAPYAAGLPAFTLPFAKIKPYLTVTVQKMLDVK